VLLDVTVVCLAAVLCSGRVREVPFDERLARGEWYVVQVDNLVTVSPCALRPGGLMRGSLSGAGQTWAARMSAGDLYVADNGSPTRRYFGTGIVSVCAAKATERSRSVDIAYRTLAW
jgi:hypothetical protein